MMFFTYRMVAKIREHCFKNKTSKSSAPAVREGSDQYNLEEYAKEYTQKLQDAIRLGWPHGVCFMVHHTVFKEHGTFDPNLKIGQYEDAGLFQDAVALLSAHGHDRGRADSPLWFTNSKINESKARSTRIRSKKPRLLQKKMEA